MKTKDTKKKKSKKNQIDLDNEIIIGLTTSNDDNKKKKKTKNKKKKNMKKNKGFNVKTNKKQNKVKSIVVKWTFLMMLLAIAIILFLLSPLFNCKKILVEGNEILSSESIIANSQIQIGENIFKISSAKVKERIKSNAYVERVRIKRNLKGEIKIIIEERKPTFMLTFAGGCVYINNQGYILEFSEEPKNLPIIIGFTTVLDDKVPGDRLDIDDLKKLEDILQLAKVAEKKQMLDLISYIDISEYKNIIISMTSEKKSAYIGTLENINKKMDYIRVIIDEEAGIAGDIFAQNLDNIYFREKV